MVLRTVSRRTIQTVVHHRTARSREMNPNLMSTASHGPRLHERRSTRDPKNAEMRLGFLSVS